MIDSSKNAAGTLYVVATPIGNLNDITHRAIEVLKSCDLVACEDTRHSQRLFQAHDIRSKTKSLHQHNENHDSQKIIDLILSGQNIALVSDAGTPLISDPGYPLLKLAHLHDITVVPIPGPSAMVTLLSVAAMNTQPFTFHGFLPAKSQQRQHVFESWQPLNTTHVFYESSHRIVATIEQLVTVFGPQAEVAMGRELTKKFEQIFRGTAQELQQLINDDKNQQKGEFVLAIQGEPKETTEPLNDNQIKLANSLKQHLPPKIAAKIVADQFGINKKLVYQFMIEQG